MQQLPFPSAAPPRPTPNPQPPTAPNPPTLRRLPKPVQSSPRPPTRPLSTRARSQVQRPSQLHDGCVPAPGEGQGMRVGGTWVGGRPKRGTWGRAPPPATSSHSPGPNVAHLLLPHGLQHPGGPRVPTALCQTVVQSAARRPRASDISRHPRPAVDLRPPSDRPPAPPLPHTPTAAAQVSTATLRPPTTTGARPLLAQQQQPPAVLHEHAVRTPRRHGTRVPPCHLPPRLWCARLLVGAACPSSCCLWVGQGTGLTMSGNDPASPSCSGERT